MALVTDRNSFLPSTEATESMELYSDNGQPAEDIDIDFDREDTAQSVNDDLMLDDIDSISGVPAEPNATTTYDETMIDEDHAADGPASDIVEEVMPDDETTAREDDEELLDFTDMDETEHTVTDGLGTQSGLHDVPAEYASDAVEDHKEDAQLEQSTGDAQPEAQISLDAPAQQSESGLVDQSVSGLVGTASVSEPAEVATTPHNDQHESDYLDDIEDHGAPAADDHTPLVVDTADHKEGQEHDAELGDDEKTAIDPVETKGEVVSQTQQLTARASGGATPSTCTGLHPIVLFYEDGCFPLFPLQAQPAGFDFQDGALLEDENLAHSSLADLLGSCRQVLRQDSTLMNDPEELVANIEVLHMHINEDSISAHSVSLFEVIEVYLQLHANEFSDSDAPPLVIKLDYKPRVAEQVQVFARLISKGGKLSDLENMLEVYAQDNELKAVDTEQLATEAVTDVTDTENRQEQDVGSMEGRPAARDEEKDVVDQNEDELESTQGHAGDETPLPETVPEAVVSDKESAPDHAVQTSHDGVGASIEQKKQSQDGPRSAADSSVANGSIPASRDQAASEGHVDDLDHETPQYEAKVHDDHATPKGQAVSVASDVPHERLPPLDKFPQLQPKARRESIPSITVSITSAPRDNSDDLDDFNDAATRQGRAQLSSNGLTAKSSVTDDGILSGVTGSATSAVMDGDPDILDFTDDESAVDTASSSRRKSGETSAMKRVRDDIIEAATTTDQQTMKRQKSS